MLLQEGRSGAGISPDLAEGWRLERLTPPSRLFGATVPAANIIEESLLPMARAKRAATQSLAACAIFRRRGPLVL